MPVVLIATQPPLVDSVHYLRLRLSCEVSGQNYQNIELASSIDSALRYLATTTMASADFCPSIPSPLNGVSPSQRGQRNRSPRVMRTHFHAYARCIYVYASIQVLDFGCSCPLIRHSRLICSFYSSGQRFAYGFLQIPPRGGHPCRSANPAQRDRDCTPSLTGPVIALCRAHKSKDLLQRRSGVISAGGKSHSARPPADDQIIAPTVTVRRRRCDTPSSRQCWEGREKSCHNLVHN